MVLNPFLGVTRTAGLSDIVYAVHFHRSGLALGAADLPSDAKTAPVGRCTDCLQGGSQGHTASVFITAYVVL